MTHWLSDYYGASAPQLSPMVVKEGRRYAIVRLSAPGHVGYVLIKKTGRHGVTPWQTLFEGVPTQSDFEAMVEKLNAADKI